MSIIRPQQLTQPFNITGSLYGTSSWALSVITSSYAQTASYAPNYTPLTSFGAFTSSYNTGSFTGSFFGDGSGLTNLPTQSISIDTGSFATTGSNRFNGNQIITGSLSQGLEGNIASGEYSHAEGSITKATGDYSHAEGDATQAIGFYSHAEGRETKTLVSAQYSHAEGYQTIASADYQHVQGQWNATSSVEAAFIIGNGTDDNNRSNLVFAAGNTFQVTGSLNVSAGITGSLFGTASWALNVLTSSYSFYAETASFSSRTTRTDLYVLNQSGQSIAKGIVVRITGSNNASDIPRVVTASYENDNNSANTLGITTEVIANGALGYVITEGVLTGIDTSNFTSGQLIYLGATGSIIGTAPAAPLHAVRLGEVIREQQNNGSIYVRIDNGYEIEELHDVRITSASNGDLLLRSGSLWINSKQLTGSYSATGSLFIVGPTNITSLSSYQTSDFFLIRNAVTAFKISEGVEITSSAQIPLRISNQASQSLLQVSQSGVVTFATFSVDPTGTAPNGGIYFTSASFYVGLD